MAASSPKARHYTTALRSALVAGSFASPSAAKAVNGTPLAWAELQRKFGKHCTSGDDRLFGGVASQTQALALLLGASNTQGEVDDVAIDGDSEWEGKEELTLGEEGRLLAERKEEASSSYEALKALDDGSKSVKLALAWHAFALGRPEECLSILSSIPDLTSSYSALPSSSTSASLTVPPSGRPGATTPVSVRSFGGQQEPPDIVDGRAWSTTESIRSLCLLGMSHEHLTPTRPALAIQTYLSALPLIQTLMSDLPNSGNAGPDSNLAFTRYREFWRWTERLLWRCIILLSKRFTSSSNDNEDDPIPLPVQKEQLSSLLSLYRSFSFPPTFRPAHRATIYKLHLRLLVLRSRSLPPLPLGRAPEWMNEARAVVAEYRGVLGVKTHFPRAEERNRPVLEFVDLVVAVWEAAGSRGESAGWAIDVMWWATRLTFNAPSLLRHQARLLLAAGDLSLARRFSRLYIQIVSKAREAARADGGGHAEPEDVDSDEGWVNACVEGVRMLCRMAIAEGDPSKGVVWAREAGEVVGKAREGMPKETEGEEWEERKAQVELVESVWEFVMAITEQNPTTRTTRLSRSLQLAEKSIALHPSAAGYHHLAILHCRPGTTHNLADAEAAAARAVELDPAEVRSWHLLGLILSARGEGKKAKGVLEVAVAIADAGLDGAEGGKGTEGEVDGVRTRDFAPGAVNGGQNGDASRPGVNGDAPPSDSSSDSGAGEEEDELLPAMARSVPHASALLDPVPEPAGPSQAERFAHAMQIRMTQLALVERSDGGENVGEVWREVFGWYASRSSNDFSSHGNKTDGSTSHRTIETRALGAPPRASMDGSGMQALAPPEPAPLVPVPISVTPASPSREEFPNGGIDGQIEESQISIITTTDETGESDVMTEKEGAGRGGRRVNGEGKRVQKVQRMVKKSVHAGQARIGSISRKIGHEVRRGSVRRSRSVSDLQEAPPFQASSIHTRRFYAPSVAGTRPPSPGDTNTISTAAPAPLGPATLPVSSPTAPASSANGTGDGSKNARERRLLSDLWLMSAATFRRMGKIEQCRGAIQEAECADEDNPGVWVQLGLYFAALGSDRRAGDALQKALFIAPDDVPAIVHLCRLHLLRAEGLLAVSTTHSPNVVQTGAGGALGEVDLAAGMLEACTHGAGWDVPEAWHLLGKAYGLQGRFQRERDCLLFALELVQGRGVREVGTAVGWIL